MIKVVVPLQQQRLIQVMKRFLFLKHPQCLHLQVGDIQEEPSKRKECISGNRIIDVNILSGIFGEMFMLLAIKTLRKNKDYHHCYI